jgi:hypothetical protein
MTNQTDKLETDLLDLLLAGDDPVLRVLRAQLAVAIRKPRQLTGVGFFTHFDFPPDALRLPGNPKFSFGDVVGDITGLQLGAGFVLHVRDGLISFLEGYTYDEPWPRAITTFNLKYASGHQRDLIKLRSSPGWPK